MVAFGMRRFLLTLLICLLPLQSFAVNLARLQMHNTAVAQAAMPCHEDVKSTASNQSQDHSSSHEDGCCKSTASCELMCTLSTVIFASAEISHLLAVDQEQPAGPSISFTNALLAQPVKPPIRQSP